MGLGLSAPSWAMTGVYNSELKAKNKSAKGISRPFTIFIGTLQ